MPSTISDALVGGAVASDAIVGGTSITDELVPQATQEPELWDFQLLADGAMPADFDLSTWVISSGKAVNTPGFSAANMLTNPGFEGVYTAGKAANWTFSATGTPTESADVHGGTKAQQFIGSQANDNLYGQVTAVNGTWYLGSVWSKRAAGVANNAYMLMDGGALWAAGPTHNDAAYTNQIMTERALANGGLRLRAYYQSGAGVGDTVVLDDAIVRPLNLVDLFAFPKVPYSSADVTAKTKIWNSQRGQMGLAICFDDPTNPQNGLLFRFGNNTSYQLDKLLNGVWSNLISVGTAHTEGESIYITKSGTQVSVWKGLTQLGTTQTITDATIINNRWHGLFGTDSSQGFSGLSIVSENPPAAQNGSILFTFDDCNDTDYTEAYSYMQPRGLIGTCFVASDMIDTANYLSTAQMNTMYANGWEFGNHGKNWDDYTLLSEADQETWFGACRTVLLGMGFDRAANIVRFPAPLPNADSLLAMFGLGVWATSTETLTYTPYGYTIPTAENITTYGHTIMEIETAMDTAIVTNKHNFKLGFHKIVIGATGADVEPAFFREIVDLVVAKGYRVIGFHEYMDGAVW